MFRLRKLNVVVAMLCGLWIGGMLTSCVEEEGVFEDVENEELYGGEGDDEPPIPPLKP